MKIFDVKIFNKKLIKGKKGNILKYISKKDSFIKSFGEIYFSYIKKNKIKGWNYHKSKSCFLICIKGNVNIHLIDERNSSKSYNKELRVKLTQHSAQILKIPPKIWFSFSSKTDSILGNFLETPHQKKETLKRDTVKNYFIKN